MQVRKQQQKQQCYPQVSCSSQGFQLTVAGDVGRRTNGYKMTTNAFNLEMNRKLLIIAAVMFPQHSRRTSAKYI